MASVVEHRKFVFCNAGINSNKVWEVILYNNDDVEVKYGRIGVGKLQSKTHSGAGRKKMESLIRSKTRESDHYNGGCYREIETLDAGSSAGGSVSKSVSSKSELKSIATKQVATCAITQKLVEFFTEVNAHNIYQATGGRITYDTSAGNFRTPIGIVTKRNVDEARELLDQITVFIQNSKFDAKFVKSLEDYLMLIPQDVGRKFDPRSFCGDINAIQRQSQILDGLESSIQSVLAGAKKDGKPVKGKIEEPKLFNVKLAVETEGKTIDRITKYFQKGCQSVHRSSGMKLRQAYRVDLADMRTAFEKDGGKMVNIHELWHGTSAANILSILKGGFIIPPSTASHVCGRMFGNGVYFANSSTKSLNYSTGYWGGRDSGRYFMFLCQVALGNFYTPTGPTSSRPPAGYDSFWAKAGKSSVMNDEIIVFRTSQINPTFLTEWGR